MRTWNGLFLASFVVFAGACSQGGGAATSAKPVDDCLDVDINNGSYHAHCSHHLSYNGEDKGAVTYDHTADPSRSCDDYQSAAKIEGNGNAEPGEVNASLDETTSKIDYGVDDSSFSIFISDQRDWLWVRSSIAGSTAETDKKVFCPGLEEEAKHRADQLGLSGAESCPGSDPHHIALGEFSCPALEHEIESREAYKVLRTNAKLYKLAVGKVLVDQAVALSVQPQNTGKRAVIFPLLGVIFSALGNVFGSKDFQHVFDRDSKTDNVTGPSDSPG